MRGYRKLILAGGFLAAIGVMPLPAESKVELLVTLMIVTFAGNSVENLGEVVKDGIRSRSADRAGRNVSVTNTPASKQEYGESAH